MIWMARLWLLNHLACWPLSIGNHMRHYVMIDFNHSIKKNMWSSSKHLPTHICLSPMVRRQNNLYRHIDSPFLFRLSLEERDY